MIPRDRLMLMSVEALTELNQAVVNVLKAKREVMARENKWTLHSGAKVRFYHRTQARWIEATVKDIKIKKATCLEKPKTPGAQSMVWNVPLHMLERAPDHDKPAQAGGIPSF